MTKLFLDTNIVIDLLDRREPFCHDAVKLFSNFRQLSRVATADERTIDDSLASSFGDFEDAMQYYTALNAEADAIITRNGKDFALSRLPVMTAGEFLATLRR